MKVVGFLIGILSFLVAGGISYLAFELRGRGQYLGWKAFPVVVAMFGLTFLGTHLTVGISSETTPLLNFGVAWFAVFLVPLFILIIEFMVKDFLAGNMAIISKPPDSGPFKRYFNITVQWIVIAILGWMIWKIGERGYKIYFG